MSRHAREQEDVTPNLIPIMNLFTALIPFLLMSAAFFRLAIINISVPVASSTGETDIAKEEDKITLNLRVMPDKFEMSASSDTLEPKKLKKLHATIPRIKSKDEEKLAAMYDKVSQAAYKIKGDYAASDTVIIVPDPQIPYEIIVEAMDAVRRTHIERDGEKNKIYLFPRVVLSSLVK